MLQTVNNWQVRSLVIDAAVVWYPFGEHSVTLTHCRSEVAVASWVSNCNGEMHRVERLHCRSEVAVGEAVSKSSTAHSLTAIHCRSEVAVAGAAM
jgi:hypothetical protein